MNRADVDRVQESLADKHPTARHIKLKCDGETVERAEIHNDDGLLWIYPKGSRPRLKVPKFRSYGNDGIKFSLKRSDYDMMGMERDMVV